MAKKYIYESKHAHRVRINDVKFTEIDVELNVAYFVHGLFCNWLSWGYTTFGGYRQLLIIMQLFKKSHRQYKFLSSSVSMHSEVYEIYTNGETR